MAFASPRQGTLLQETEWQELRLQPCRLCSSSQPHPIPPHIAPSVTDSEPRPFRAALLLTVDAFEAAIKKLAKEHNVAYDKSA